MLLLALSVIFLVGAGTVSYRHMERLAVADGKLTESRA